jgi:hypothetical protein
LVELNHFTVPVVMMNPFKHRVGGARKEAPAVIRRNII